MPPIFLFNRYSSLSKVEQILTKCVEMIFVPPLIRPVSLNSGGILQPSGVAEPSSVIVVPYKSALMQKNDQPALKRRVSYWRRNVASPTGETRRERIRQKFEVLKASSSPKRPVCFKYGSPGHLREQCRNAVLCCLSNQFGHTTSCCKAVTDIPPQKSSVPHVRNPPVSVRSTSKSSATSPLLDLNMNREMAMKLPVLHFFASPHTKELEQHFRQSFMLEDTEEWGAEQISEALHHHKHKFCW